MMEKQVGEFKFTWDYEAEAGYLYLGDEDKDVEETMDLGNGNVIDFDENMQIIGVEFLNRKSLPDNLYSIVSEESSSGLTRERAKELRSELEGSALAVDILYNLWRTEGNYTSQIARDINRPQPSVDRVLSKLREAEIVESSNHGAKKILEINYEHVAGFTLKSLDVEENDIGDNDFNLVVEEYQEFLSFYFNGYRDYGEKTFGELFFDDFFFMLQARSYGNSAYDDLLRKYAMSELSEAGKAFVQESTR
jgi:uncharacterized protein YuzE